MLHIGAVAAGEDFHRLAVFGVVAEGAQRLGPAAPGRLVDQRHRPVETDRQQVFVRAERGIAAVVAQIRPVPAETRGNRLSGPGMGADIARQRQKRQCLVERDLLRIHRLEQRDAFGFLLALALGLARLHVEAVGPLAQGYRFPGFLILAHLPGSGRDFGVLGVDRERPREGAFRIGRATDERAVAAELEPEAAVGAGRAGSRVAAVPVVGREEMRAQIPVQRVDHVADREFRGPAHRRGKPAPEVLQHRLPLAFAPGDPVELVFEVRREVVLDIAVEESGQERGDDAAPVFRHEPPALQPHIVPLLEHAQDLGVGRRAADAELFQPAHQARLGVARRRLGEVLFRVGLSAVELFAFRHRREDAFVPVLRGVVAPFLVEPEEAVEQHHRAGGAEDDRPVGRGDVHGDLLEPGAVHLARHRPRPDQLVEPPFVAFQRVADRGRPACHVGRADRLMGLLRVLGARPEPVGAGGNVGRPVLGLDQPAHRLARLVGEVDAVRAHIGDQPHGLAAEIDPLVEPLRAAHGPGRAEPELARGFLLQRRRGEWRLRVAPDLFLLDRRDAVCVTLDLAHRRRRGLLVGNVVAAQLGAVQMGKPGRDGRLSRGQELGLDRPVFARPEDLDLGFPLADQAERDRLNPPRRAGARQLAPQHRREREADEVVERAPREIGVDQPLIEIARVAERFVDRGLGDLVKHHPLDVDILENGLFGERRADMPGDRLAFAVRVRREVEILRVPDRADDRGEVLLRSGHDLPAHGETVIRKNRAVLLRQVPDMAVTRQNGVSAADIFGDCLGLGRRLDDDDIHWAGRSLI